MTTGYEMARLRASRVVPRPQDQAKLDTLRSAASRAARCLVEVSADNGSPAVVLGWPAGHEPAERSEMHRQASPTVQLVLAACLRCCWPDPDVPLYPGAATTEDRVFAALEGLDPPQLVDPEESRNGRYRARKSALRTLRACAFLMPDNGDGIVRLGPAVALWTPTDVTELRRDYHVLPGPPEERT